MANTEAQPANSPATAIVQAEANQYRMSREGRRQAVILFVGVLSLLVFALWSLITILDGGLDGAEWVSALLMFGILVVSPLVAWTLLEEANAYITVTDEGLRYTTLAGVTLIYPWAELAGFKQPGGRSRIARFFLGDEDKIDTDSSAAALRDDANIEEEESEEEPETLALLVRDEYKGRLESQLPNPVVRFLHLQAHGTALPIYGGLENRGELLTEINSRLNKNE